MDLAVDDIPKALRFYSAEFGWEMQEGGPEVGGYTVATLGGRSAAGIGPKMGPAEVPSMWTTYLAADDVAAIADRIDKAGGKVLSGPMDVMDLGKMLVALDTTGGAFGVWQAAKHTGAQVANVAGAQVWNEQMSHDFEAAKAFYGAVFGYEFQDMSSEGFSYATLKLGGNEVGGIGAYPAAVPKEAPGSWTVYFGVENTDAAAQAAVQAGGTITHPPTDTPYGRMAMVTDDQGAAFSVMSVSAGE